MTGGLEEAADSEMAAEGDLDVVQSWWVTLQYCGAGSHGSSGFGGAQ